MSNRHTAMVAVLCIFAAAIVHADTFTNKKTGEVLEGRVVTTVKKDGKEMMFVRLTSGQSRFLPTDRWRRQISKSGYIVVPVKGVIGADFKAEHMEAYLKQVARKRPSIVVLEIDTPGGLTTEAKKIVRLMLEARDVRLVAFVKQALSAGVPIALACQEIYVGEGATIGGAVSYAVDDKGRLMTLPNDIAKKMQSIWRAACRAAAERGKHSTLIPEAMIDPDFVLTARSQGGKKILERNGSGRIVKKRGEVLTLTGPEAVECGLAEALVTSYEFLGEKLAMKGWQRIRVPAVVPPKTVRRVQPRIPVNGWKDKANWRKLKTGMTMNQVRQVLGEPGKVSTRTIVDIVYTRWYYPDALGGDVAFKDGRVTGWGEP